MSLFIGGLAFEHVGGDAETYMMTHRMGILAGSLIAGIAGYLILKRARPAEETASQEKVTDKVFSAEDVEPG